MDNRAAQPLLMRRDIRSKCDDAHNNSWKTKVKVPFAPFWCAANVVMVSHVFQRRCKFFGRS